MARALLLAVVAVALLEWVAASRAYRTSISEDDWTQLQQAVAALPANEPVVLADEWLAQPARMRVPQLTRLSMVAPPDLREPERVHVLGAGHAWSDALDADLEDRVAPQLDETQSFGGLTLTTYRFTDAAPAIASFVDDVMSLEVSSQGRKCEGKRTFKCKQGRVRSRTVEIDYRPRRCIEVDVSDATTVELTYPQMALGTVLRGHVGFGDFNRRLRSDAPVQVEVRIGDRVAARYLATDAEGWRPLAVATEPGPADVTVALTVAVQGSWGRTGYSERPAHADCMELRALSQGGGEP